MIQVGGRRFSNERERQDRGSFARNRVLQR